MRKPLFDDLDRFTAARQELAKWFVPDENTDPLLLFELGYLPSVRKK